MSGINNESFKGKKKYTKLLNNLLGIKGRDQTIFTKVNNVDAFDITTKFSPAISKKIIDQKEFSVILTETDLEDLIDRISNSDDPELIIALFDKYKQRIFNTKKLLLANPETFEQAKADLLAELQEKHQREKIRWKQYRRKVLDSNTQDNVWPLHVATMFISLKGPTKNLYGPLLLREAELNIVNEEIQLKSEASWKLNEKLIFLLGERGYFINKDDFDEDDDFQTMVDRILLQLNSPELTFNFTDEFKNYKTDDITNKFIAFHPGVVLGLFKPSGGNLRKTMQHIIDNDEIDEILDADPDKNIYRQRVNQVILEESERIIHIQPSNFSQDKALISSLIQDTVIQGPPGTGKSQVIANIIANVFYQNKTAIVMSQKKAALDVLKKRLGSIAPFTLFILNDNKMSKEEFYKSLKEFVDKVENSCEVWRSSNEKIITPEELKALEIISRTKKANTFDPALKVLEMLDAYDLHVHDLEILFSVSPNYQYPELTEDLKTYEKAFMDLNNLEYKKVLWIKKVPEHYKPICEHVFKIRQRYHVDLNALLALKGDTPAKDIIDLFKVSRTVFQNHDYESDESYLQGLLAKRTMDKIKYWKHNYQENKYRDYKRFAMAVRAERSLPYRFMNDHISIIQELFPIIVTTPETDFINWEKEYFDYAILDESSQMFLEVGLPILYLAKTKVLAGDTQQMQPSRWFMTRDSIDEQEEDIAENAESLLDYAMDKGIYSVMLDKNYRSSAAALMSFSSKEFYDSKLDVLDNKEKPVNQAIEVINVNGQWDKGVNAVEAEKAIQVALDIIDDYNSLIILAFNADQRQLIEKEIIENYPKLFKAMEDEKLSVRNIENIQGDEADAVIISVVYDSTTSMASTYVARQGGKNALNVAVSRAKDKMIVIKSVSYQTIKNANSADFVVFKNWLEFLDMNSDDQKNFAQTDNPNVQESFGEVDSAFEADVVNFIKGNIKPALPVKVIKQYEVGSFAIDIALLDQKNNFIIGIEVDGYDYHLGTGFDKYLNDLSRQEFLESKGYDIYRVSEIDFKINRDKIKYELTSILRNKLPSLIPVEGQKAENFNMQ